MRISCTNNTISLDSGISNLTSDVPVTKADNQSILGSIVFILILEDAFKRQFSKYITLGIRADDLEEIYKKAHASIRTDPTHKKKEKSGVVKKRWTMKKLTLEQRKKKVAEHKAAYLVKLQNESEA